jgi:LAO/AO transport system kinase
MMSIPISDYSALIERFNNKDRAALAKMITIVESSAPDVRKDADRILYQLRKADKKAIRIAISGPPGVGKSTFINRFGKKLIEKNYSLAILPIDPSSELTLGSILADKTRMKDLLSSDRVFIRPSPSKGNFSGIALTTHDVVFVVEAFGFDIVIIETVGVGQSETIAYTLADHFVVLLQPGSGDQLQAMKKGILERADFILVNKTDEEQRFLAQKTKSSLKVLKTLSLSGHDPYIAAVSALMDFGIDDFLAALLSRHQSLKISGQLDMMRKRNGERFFKFSFDQLVAYRLWNAPRVATSCHQILKDYLHDRIPLSPALNHLMDEIVKKY